MRTSEQECLAALRDAADQLGKSPTKAEYEELGLRPASATIIRVVGGWNKAKERADLATEPSTGSRTKPKPDNVSLPADTDWEQLSVDQRWHYRNVEQNTKRTLERRARLRSWVNERKRERGCQNCEERDPACLDFHHQDPSKKEMAITDLITFGYSRERLRVEIANCEVLCANCHRIEHHSNHDRALMEPKTGDQLETPGSVPATDDREKRRAWLARYKAAIGCGRCTETDPRCLVFHHDTDEKRDRVSQMVSDGRPAEEIEDEINRCTVLCSNCHRKEHFEPPAPTE